MNHIHMKKKIGKTVKRGRQMEKWSVKMWAKHIEMTWFFHFSILKWRPENKTIEISCHLLCSAHHQPIFGQTSYCSILFQFWPIKTTTWIQIVIFYRENWNLQSKTVKNDLYCPIGWMSQCLKWAYTFYMQKTKKKKNVSITLFTFCNFSHALHYTPVHPISIYHFLS